MRTPRHQFLESAPNTSALILGDSALSMFRIERRVKAQEDATHIVIDLHRLAVQTNNLF
jgi:hypothetical protein